MIDKKRIYFYSAAAAMCMAAGVLCAGCKSDLAGSENQKASITEAAQTETELQTEAKSSTTTTTENTSTAEKTAGTKSSTASTKLTMRVGLSESSISNTEFGRYTRRSGGYVGSWCHQKHYAYDYYWEDANGKFLLKVHTYDGSVDYIIQNAVTYNKDSKVQSVHPITSSSGKTSSSKSSGTVRKRSTTSVKTDSYDDGYNDIYEDGDYDYKRYRSDDDYARGVDDAMDECEDDW